MRRVQEIAEQMRALYWSARIGRSYRAVAVEVAGPFLWIWIGRHDPYERELG